MKERRKRDRETKREKKLNKGLYLYEEKKRDGIKSMKFEALCLKI